MKIKRQMIMVHSLMEYSAQNIDIRFVQDNSNALGSIQFYSVVREAANTVSVNQGRVAYSGIEAANETHRGIMILPMRRASKESVC